MRDHVARPLGVPNHEQHALPGLVESGRSVIEPAQARGGVRLDGGERLGHLMGQ